LTANHLERDTRERERAIEPDVAVERCRRRGEDPQRGWVGLASSREARQLDTLARELPREPSGAYRRAQHPTDGVDREANLVGWRLGHRGRDRSSLVG
jgi:hypothetical protein